VCVASEPTKVLFIPLKRPDWTRNGAFRKRDASSENSLWNDVKSSMVKGKEAEWIGWKYERVGPGLKAWRGCLWVPPTNHFSNRAHTTFAFVLTHISNFPPRWPFGTWHGGDPGRRERKRGSNIPHTYPPLLHDWYWMKNTFRRNAIYEIQRVHPIASIRIWTLLQTYDMENDSAFQSFNIVGRYAHKDNCIKKEMEISG